MQSLIRDLQSMPLMELMHGGLSRCENGNYFLPKMNRTARAS